MTKLIILGSTGADIRKYGTLTGAVLLPQFGKYVENKNIQKTIKISKNLFWKSRELTNKYIYFFSWGGGGVQNW